MADRRQRIEFGAAVLVDLIGAAGALLIASRPWQTIVTPRQHPLADDVLRVTGRTVDTAITALALVALAGVVAVLATRGWGRRLIGGVLTLAGAALVWRSIAGFGGVSAARARSLVQSKHSGVGVDAGVVPHVTVHTQWPVLTAICGVLVAAAGLLIVLRGHRWAGMSARYDAPGPVSEVDAETARTRASATLWSALDRGDDPTRGEARDPAASEPERPARRTRHMRS